MRRQLAEGLGATGMRWKVPPGGVGAAVGGGEARRRQAETWVGEGVQREVRRRRERQRQRWTPRPTESPGPLSRSSSPDSLSPEGLSVPWNQESRVSDGQGDLPAGGRGRLG